MGRLGEVAFVGLLCLVLAAVTMSAVGLPMGWSFDYVWGRAVWFGAGGFAGAWCAR